MKIVKKVQRPEGKVTPRILKMVDGEMKEVRRYDTAQNVVTNKGMANIYSRIGAFSLFFYAPSAFRYLRVGTNTTVPTAATERDATTYAAAVANPEYSKSSVQYEDIEGTMYMVMRVSYVFSLGALNGTFTEFATFASSSQSPTYYANTAALFRDSGGNPVAITVGAEEQLVVDYEFRILPHPDEDTSLNINNTTIRLYSTPATFPASVVVNSVTHTVTPLLEERAVYLPGPLTSNSRTYYLNLPYASGSYSNHGEITDGSDTVTQWTGVNANGSFATVKTDAANGLSTTYTATVTIAPSSGITEVAKVGCMSYAYIRPYLQLEFDPPIPIPAGDRFDVTAELVFDWS